MGSLSSNIDDLDSYRESADGLPTGHQKYFDNLQVSRKERMKKHVQKLEKHKRRRKHEEKSSLIKMNKKYKRRMNKSREKVEKRLIPSSIQNKTFEETKWNKHAKLKARHTVKAGVGTVVNLTCLTKAIKLMKFQKDNLNNFLKRQSRFTRQSNLIGDLCSKHLGIVVYVQLG